MLILHNFKTEDNYMVDTVLLYYINSMTGNTKEYEVKLNVHFPVMNDTVVYDYSVPLIMNRFNDLHTYVQTNILPPKDYRNDYGMGDVARLYKDKIINNHARNISILNGFGVDNACADCPFLTQCKNEEV